MGGEISIRIEQKISLSLSLSMLSERSVHSGCPPQVTVPTLGYTDNLSFLSQLLWHTQQAARICHMNARLVFLGIENATSA